MDNLNVLLVLIIIILILMIFSQRNHSCYENFYVIGPSIGDKVCCTQDNRDQGYCSGINFECTGDGCKKGEGKCSNNHKISCNSREDCENIPDQVS